MLPFIKIKYIFKIKNNFKIKNKNIFYIFNQKIIYK